MPVPLNVKFEFQVGDKCILCGVADLQREREREIENCSQQMCDATATILCSSPSNNHKSMVILCEKFLPHIILFITGWFLFFSMEIMLDAMKGVGMHVSFYNNLDLYLEK